MRKTVFIIYLLLLCNCGQKPGLVIENFPTIVLQTGVEKELDVTKYVVGFKNISIGKTTGVEVDYDPVKQVIRLLADGSKVLILLPLDIDNNEIHLLLRINPMVEHTFSFKSEEAAASIVVMGQFNDWSRTALSLSDNNGDGVYERTVYLKPQRHEYKFVVDGEEMIDPANPVFVSNNIGGWNSVLDLSEFKAEPSGKIVKEDWEKEFLTFRYKPQDDSIVSNLIVMHNNSIVDEELYHIDNNNLISIKYTKLDDGVLRLAAIDDQNRLTNENITIIKNGKVLNPSDHPDDWHFTVLYNLMVDRFLDGDTANTQKVQTGNLYDLANWQGGDLAGIIQKLEDGYFTELGINTIWISPLNRQPDSAFVEWIPPNNKFTGYHGYWPVAARAIDPRYGTEEEFKKLVKLAHSKNMKVLLDFVSNHVHQEHPYFEEYRDWFGSVELPNGEMNIRNWSEETRLTTWFDEFIPSFDYPSAPEAIDQVVEDAVWWMETFDLDGFRQDAVKHVPHAFWKQLTLALCSKFPDKDFYQIGETFGSDDLILDYVNPNELDAQFNFDIYFNARGQFASANTDFAEIAKVLERNVANYRPVNLMGNITSSHDQMRFIGVADGQVAWGDDCYERSFFSPPGEVQNSTSYSKLANFHAFNISIPGIPVVYYGEEIGLMGSCDPGNRRVMRFGHKITNTENELLSKISSLNNLRRKYPALALGDLEIISAKGSLLIMQKSYLNEKLIVVINNGSTERSIAPQIPHGKLKDLLSVNIVLINDNKFELIIEPYSYRFFEVI